MSAVDIISGASQAGHFSSPAPGTASEDNGRSYSSDLMAPEVQQTAEYSVKKLQQHAKQANAAAADALSVEELREVVEQLRAAMPEQSNSLRFSVDEVLNRPIVSVVDEKSGKLIRQLPSEEVIRAAHNIESMRGILFDYKG